MKLKNKVLLCKECIDSLIPFDDHMPAYEWAKTCIYNSSGKLRTLYNSEYGNPVLRNLEKEGYIITTEKNEKYIYIKAKGFQYSDENGDLYCLSPHTHGEYDE